MKISPLDQGSNSKDWLAWRKTIITATDCPAILGISPYTTAYQAWQYKHDLIKPQASNAAMENGKRLEPIARDRFIVEFGIYMEPECVESEEFNFLGASLDGISECRKYILEIKCNGHDRHEQVRKGIIPDFHIAQMQHQLLVTGAEKCFYYSFHRDEGVCIEVLPDPLFVQDFLPKARAFWKNVAFFEAPALSDRDYRDMNNNLSWKDLSAKYQEIDSNLKMLEEKKDYIRKELISLCADQPSMGNGVKVIKTTTKGRVDYDMIPELQAVNVDQYRKKPSDSWKIMISNRMSA